MARRDAGSPQATAIAASMRAAFSATKLTCWHEFAMPSQPRAAVWGADMVEIGHRRIQSGSVRPTPPGCAGIRGSIAHTLLCRVCNRDIPAACIGYGGVLARAVGGNRHGAARTVMRDLAAADPAGASCAINE